MISVSVYVTQESIVVAYFIPRLSICAIYW